MMDFYHILSEIRVCLQRRPRFMSMFKCCVIWEIEKRKKIYYGEMHNVIYLI